MGIINVPELASYWITSWTSHIPFFGNILPRNRFELIFWMLHVSSVPVGQTPKRIDKVRVLLDELISSFKANWQPSQNLSVDETMIGFRGRFGAKQYIPNKPTKYGVKAFTLADSLNGYILDILVYTGADTLQNAHPTYQQMPQPARIVLHLTKDYLNQGRTIFTDRYYTSIPLLQDGKSMYLFYWYLHEKQEKSPQQFQAKKFSTFRWRSQSLSQRPSSSTGMAVSQ